MVSISLVGKSPNNKQDRDKLKATTNLVLIDPEMVWILHNIPGEIKDQVFAREIHRRRKA